MAVLGSTLLSLCFGMLLLSASSADYPDRCMSFSTVYPTTGPGIKINSNIYESNRIYTISVPVDSSTNSVVLRAMDTNNNSSVGLWQTADGLWKIADPVCNGSVLYQRPDTREGFFKANWQSPRFTNITVEIQAFVINVNRVATFSSLKLENQAMITTSPSMTSMTSMTSRTSMTYMTRPTTTRSPTTNRFPTTAKTATSTLTTTKASPTESSSAPSQMPSRSCSSSSPANSSSKSCSCLCYILLRSVPSQGPVMCVNEGLMFSNVQLS